MPRYIVMAAGLIYADVVLPDLASSVLEACRQADAAVGENVRGYWTVARDSDKAEYEVYVADPNLPAYQPPDIQTDLTYVASVAGTVSSEVPIPIRPVTGPAAKTDLRTFALASAQRQGPTQAQRDATEAARPAIVTASAYPSLYEALDLLTREDGGESGIGGYVAGRRWRTALPNVDDTLSKLTPSDFNDFVVGPTPVRESIAARSPALTTAAELLDEFIGR